MTSITIILSVIVILLNILFLVFQGRRVRNNRKLKIEIWNLKRTIIGLEFQNKILQNKIDQK